MQRKTKIALHQRCWILICLWGQTNVLVSMQANIFLVERCFTNSADEHLSYQYCKAHTLLCQNIQHYTCQMKVFLWNNTYIKQFVPLPRLDHLLSLQKNFKTHVQCSVSSKPPLCVTRWHDAKSTHEMKKIIKILANYLAEFGEHSKQVTQSLLQPLF